MGVPTGSSPLRASAEATGSGTPPAADRGSNQEPTAASSGSGSASSSGFGAGLAGKTSEDSPPEGERRPRRRRSRSASSSRPGSAKADTSAPAAEPESSERASEPTGGSEEDGEGAPRRKRRSRRGGRGRRSGSAARSAEGAENAEGAGDQPADSPEAGDAGTTAPVEKREDAEDGEKKKRRRRGSRGGRRTGLRSSTRTKATGPVELEAIPGEDDDLGAREELLDLPEDAQLITPEEGASTSTRGGRKKRTRRRRGAAADKQAEPDEEEDDEEEGETSPRSRRSEKTKKKALPPNNILVNAVDPEETRVAVVEGGVITDFQMTVKRHNNLVNDIYRGKVVNLEPAIGAAFIDFGQGRNGFLHTSDVLSAYGDADWSLDKLLTTPVDSDDFDAVGGADEEETGADAGSEAEEDAGDEQAEDSGDEGDAKGGGKGRGRGRGRGKRERKGRKSARSAPRHRARPRLPISDLLKKGQSVVVQVTKEAIGDKGPTLTTYISIPGRYLVLMPSMARTGVSRKIDDEKERKRLKRILEGLEIPTGMGVIVRTAGTGCTKADIKRDLDYLLLLWDSFGKRLNLGRGPAPLYEESDVAIRTIRDLFNDSTESVVVDDQAVFERVRDFTKKLMPENLERIVLHDGKRPLLHSHSVEQDFERIFARRIDLPAGGSIVLDQTEALVAIDVNSGKTRSDGFDFEEIALKTNLDAVPEIARQIRLRDLGGIIVCDFIDMLRSSNRRLVERALRTAISTDRARSKLGRISQFGLLEMTRQRLGPGLSKMLFQNCTRCRGSGRMRTVESRCAAILRRLGSALTLKGFSKVEVRTHEEVIAHLKRNFSAELKELERTHERTLSLVEAPDQVEDCVLRYLRADGREVRPGGRRKR